MVANHSLPKLGKIDSIEISSAVFTMLENNIVWVQYKFVEEEFDLPDAILHTDTLRSLGKGKPVHLVLDFRKGDASFTNEARAYFAQDARHATLRLSQALVLKSLAHKIVANFYLKFNKPTCPAAVFSDPEEAVKWIRAIPGIH
jgi:hypothetical protein